MKKINVTTLQLLDIKPDIIAYLEQKGYTCEALHRNGMSLLSARLDMGDTVIKFYRISNETNDVGGDLYFHEDDRVDFKLWRKVEGGTRRVNTIGKPQDPSKDRLRIEGKIYHFLTTNVYDKKQA